MNSTTPINITLLPQASQSKLFWLIYCQLVIKVYILMLLYFDRSQAKHVWEPLSYFFLALLLLLGIVGWFHHEDWLQQPELDVCFHI